MNTQATSAKCHFTSLFNSDLGSKVTCYPTVMVPAMSRAWCGMQMRS